MIVKLENLPNHRSTCNHDPDAEVTCDKGCNLKILRRELENNCHDHFENELRSKAQQISKLLEKAQEQQTASENVIANLKQQVTELNRKITQQSEEEQFSKVSIIYIGPTPTPIWEIHENMTIGNGVLKINDKSMDGYAQFGHQLQYGNASFSIHVLKNAGVRSIVMGVARKGCLKYPPGYHGNSYGYASDGTVALDQKYKNTGEAWKDGDVITCKLVHSLLFGFVFYRNNEVVANFRLPVTDNADNLFPTVYFRCN